jgi:hypothetical protein
MSELRDELQAQIDALGATDEEIDIDHDPTNGRWLKKEFADALERWGYQTARNAHIFGLETDVVARRARLRDEPDDYIVAECKDWHTTLVGREAVASISHRALLARAMPVLVVAWGVTTQAWCLASCSTSGSSPLMTCSRSRSRRSRSIGRHEERSALVGSHA